MAHTSIPVQGSIEVFENTQISPFVSYSKVKVFYVGHNRNGTYIDRHQAEELGNKLPGSPVVGNYNPETGDFGAHDREFGYDPVTKTFKDVDLTKAYGFVPPNAKVWFQKFEEDGEIREYVCTECYIWTGIYPESQRIVDKGNNQSMELNEEKFSGNWAEDSNSHRRFFIINEAIIEKLCILGEDHEPCFEGAQFRTNFSLHDEFEALKQSMYSLMQDMMKQGGLNNPMNENETKLTGTEGQNPETEFEKKPKDGEQPEGNQEGKSGENNSNKNENNTEGSGDKGCENGDPEKKGKKYNLDEVEEYQTLKGEYATLQRQFAALQEANNQLTAEIEPLRTFKAEAEKAKKEAMINSFYMLSDEDKSDVVANIDKYSLEEIESKLAVIGMRNKVNFGLSQEVEKETPPQAEEQNLLFNLQGAAQAANDNVPAWIKAVQETQKNL